MLVGNSKIKTSFLKVIKFAVGVCKSEIFIGVNIMNFWIQFIKISFWQQITKGGKIHCGFSGKIL